MLSIPKLLRSSSIILLFFALSKVTGFGKLILMTNLFGVTGEADALTAGLQLPELFSAMVSGGALAAALIPVYSRYVVNDDYKGRNELASTVITLVFLTIGGLCLIAALFAPWLTEVVLVPDFSAENRALTAELMRITMIAMTLLGVSAAISGLLNAHQHFALPAAATVAIDLGQIVGLLLFAPRFGIHGAAWGVVLGTACHLLIQVPGLIKYRVEIRPKLNFKLKGVRDVLRLMGPRVITIGGAQASDLVIIRIASGLPEGSVSGYFYALLLAGIPTSLFAWALGTVVFPTMAERYNAGDLKGMKQTASRGLVTLWWFMLPSIVGLIALGRPGIAFLFERGEFDSEATVLIYTLVAILSLRMLSDTLLVIFERVFYARHDTRTIMFVSLGWLTTYISLAAFLTPRIGASGLAWANGVSFFIQGIVLYVLARRTVGSFDEKFIIQHGGRVVLACIPLAAVMLTLQTFDLSPTQFVILSIPLGGILYLLTWLLLSRSEWSSIRRALQPQP